MKRRTFLLGTMMGVAMGSFAAQAQAADYPRKQVELIVPYSAGGGTDLVARAFADAANKNLPKAIGVVNRTGGGDAVGLTAIAKARSNGYTIDMGTAESPCCRIWALQALPSMSLPPLPSTTLAEV